MIVKLQPSLKDYLWGGTKLKRLWGKQSELPRLAESWELSFCHDSPSVIADGEHKGKPLFSVATLSDWGKNCNKFNVFPTLVKLIDADENLSVQVHPSDEFALKKEGQLGKTEMWHVLDAEKDAVLYLGLNQNLSEQEFLRAVRHKEITRYLNEIPVRAGETYFVPSGTLHAIGGGITLLEIQQNSTLTYRVYDFDRTDSTGKKRELHLEKALEVVDLQRYVVPNPSRESFLGGCEYFSAYKHVGKLQLKNDDSFTSLTVTDGQVFLNDLLLNKGETAFVSAGETAEVFGNGCYVTVCVE